MDSMESGYNLLTQDPNPPSQPYQPSKSKYANKRRRADRRADQTLAAVLASTGLISQRAITEAINGRADGYQITIKQVQQDIKTGLSRYADIAPDDPQDAKLLQIARLDLLRTLALEAFIDSCSTTTVTTTQTDGKERITTSTRKTAPDAKYLALAADIEKERNKIFGVYAPERQEQVGTLTVTFAWKETPPPDSQNALTDSVEAEYRLADSESDATDGQQDADNE